MATAVFQDSKYLISIRLTTSSPPTYSLSDLNPPHPFAVIAHVKQIASPTPTRPITILTDHSLLDDDAFYHKYLTLPGSILDPTRKIFVQTRGSRNMIHRLGGDPDMRLRDGHRSLRFVSVPAVGEGTAEIRWKLPPEKLFELGNGSIVENMAKYQPGERFRVKLLGEYWGPVWFTLGSLDDALIHTPEDDLREKKFSRWKFPEDWDGQSIGKDVVDRLEDHVDLDDVNDLPSRHEEGVERKPNISEMAKEGWVFSMPDAWLEHSVENEEEGAVFEFVE